jgi:two-component system cell cycle sensor histidine kinase/response regulator CckA
MGKKPIRTIVVASEISDQKSVEPTLHGNEQLFYSLVENLLDTVVIIDWDGTVLFVNEAGVKLVGLDSSESALGMNVTTFVHPDSLNNVLHDLELVKQGRGGFLAEYKIMNISGEPKWIEARGNKIEFKGSSTDLIIIRDISERKKAEMDRKQLELQLHRAQRMEAIGTLAGGIAHDFNNLLMTIQGNVSLMLHDIDANHSYKQSLNNIEQAVKKGSKLTAQLLGYSQKGRYQLQLINLNDLVKETAEAFTRAKKEITIHCDLATNLDSLIADEGQLEQVLLNLFVNAAGAMPKGGDLTLKTAIATDKDIKSERFYPKPGKYVKLTVADTGTGMHKKTIDHIFEPFFTTKEIGKGTGLGLASVYGIVKGHGGYIDVESELNCGTTFSLFFPAIAETIKDTKGQPSMKADMCSTVLIVDDEDQVLDVSIKLLKRMGYKVVGTKSGKDAISIFKNKKDEIKLVILDMIMPDMGGGKVYDEIKDINPQCKVLLSSGYSIEGQAQEILDRGCNGFIQKPFNLTELSEKINKIITYQ